MNGELREKIERAVRKAITRRLIAETDPVRSFNVEFRLAETDAAIEEATDAILSSLQGWAQPVAYLEVRYGDGPWKRSSVPPGETFRVGNGEYRLPPHPASEQAGEVERLRGALNDSSDRLIASADKLLAMHDRAVKAEQALADMKAERALDRAAIEGVLDWAGRRCPCGPPDYEVDEPKICPLCRADRDDIVNGSCKAAESTVPPHILSALRDRLSKGAKDV